MFKPYAGLAHKVTDNPVGCAVRTNGRGQPAPTAWAAPRHPAARGDGLGRTRVRPPRWGRLLLAGAALALGGCASLGGERFTLQADLPANFKFSGDAYYVPAPGETCGVKPRRNGPAPDRKFFDSDYQGDAHRVEFQVPLSDTVDGCPLVLNSMRIDLGAKWGEQRWGSGWSQIGGDYASLVFRDALPAGYPGMPDSGVREFQGQCMWLFRTQGPNRYIRKVLKCQALDEQGLVRKAPPGGGLQRDQLAGRTVRLVIGLSEEERPYMGDTWVRFPNGWKRCLGKNLEDQYGFCRGNTTDFKSFKMPDGRECTIYPGCTE